MVQKLAVWSDCCCLAFCVRTLVMTDHREGVLERLVEDGKEGSLETGGLKRTEDDTRKSYNIVAS